MPKKPSSSIFGRVRGILGKGQLQRAIEEVQSALQKDPTDMRLLHKLGDLYAKSDQLPQAVEAYVKVAETYFERSFFQKSLAVYKKVSKLVPERLDLQHRLAEVYGALDRRSDALNQYQELAQAYESRQLTSKCIAVFREMVQLEPTNIPIRVKLAELYLSTSSQEEAIDEFLDALSQLKGEQRWSDYIKVAERLLFVDPENLDILKNLAELYLHEDDTMKAVAKLQQAFKIDRQDPDTLELLAEAFIKLGQHKKILSVLHELAKVYTSNNASDKAREVYQQILEYDPNDAVAHQGLQTLPPESVEELEAVAVEEVSNFEVEEVDDFEVEEVSDFEDSTTEAPLSAPQSTSEIDELVAEAEVYLKYGLLHKVQETLDNVLPQMPNHYRARRLQIDLLRQQDEHEQAASQLLQLARELGKTPEGLECVEAILEFEELSAELQEEAYQLHVSLQNIATPAPASEVQEIEYHDFDDDDDTTYQPSSQVEMMGVTEVVEEVEEIEDIDMLSHESLEAIPAAPPAQVYDDASETTDIREAFVPPVSDPTPVESFPVPEPPAVPTPYTPPSFAPPEEEKGDDPFAQFLNSRDKQEIEDEDIHQATGNFESFLSEPIEVEQPQSSGGSGAGWGDEGVSDMEAAAARLEALIRAKEGDEEESGGADAAPPTPPPPAPFSIPAPPTLATAQEEVQEEAPPPLSFTPPPPSQPVEEPMLDSDATPAEGVPSFSEEIPLDTTTPSMEAIDSIEEPLSTDPTPAEGVPSFSDQATQESFELDDVDGLLDGFDDEEEIVEDAGDLIIEEFDEFSQYAEELEEAILYMEQEEYEYALELYQQVLEQDPENREAREGHDKALIGIERQNKAREQQRAEAIEFDLDSALGTTTPGSSRSRARAVEAINEFTKAVQEQVGEEEGETHFELGIAYREMGLFSQAVEAFELCRRGRYREIDSLKMIGHCQIAQGRIDEAIQSYQLALDHPSLRPAERVDLLFESGSAYELSNMTEQALQCFEEVSQIDADYRGVQEKIQNLRSL